MKVYRVAILTIFLLVLATGLYGASERQGSWNTTLFGALLFDGGSAFDIGGAVGYNLTSRLELEGEGSIAFSDPNSYIISAGVLYNFDVQTEKLSPYALGGLAYTGVSGKGGDADVMLGGGIKYDIRKSFKIRFDLRFYLGDGTWTKLSTGLMWTFD